MPEREFSPERDLRGFLENQFDHPETVEVNGTAIDIHDLTPPEQKTEIPTVVVPGWSATASVLKENIVSLAEHGRRVIVASAPHGVETEASPLYPQIELQKAEAIVGAMDHKDIPVADAVSHSEAGVFLAIGATEHTDRFRNLVLVSPGGLIGPDNLPRLGLDFNRDILGQWAHGAFRNNEHGKKSLKAIHEAIKAWIDDPQKTWQAIMAMVEYEIPDLLKGLKQEGHGITIIHGAHDLAFPMKRMAGSVERGQVKPGVVTKDMVDGFISVRGSHNQMYLEPHPFTELIDQQLDALERKYSRQQP